MNEQLADKILERIDGEKIAPIPRWHFVLWRGIFWLLAIASVLFGSLAVATMIFLFSDYYRHDFSPPPFVSIEFFLALPYLWIGLFALLVVVARESIRRTRSGYKYHFYLVVLGSVILSLLFGIIFHCAGVGRITHEYLHVVPVYSSITPDSKDVWNRPQMGRLAGFVVSVAGTRDFIITDFNGQKWFIHVATATQDYFVPKPSSTVRVFGIPVSSSSNFTAGSVMEWEE